MSVSCDAASTIKVGDVQKGAGGTDVHDAVAAMMLMTGGAQAGSKKVLLGKRLSEATSMGDKLVERKLKKARSGPKAQKVAAKKLRPQASETSAATNVGDSEDGSGSGSDDNSSSDRSANTMNKKNKKKNKLNKQKTTRESTEPAASSSTAEPPAAVPAAADATGASETVAGATPVCANGPAGNQITAASLAAHNAVYGGMFSMWRGRIDVDAWRRATPELLARRATRLAALARYRQKRHDKQNRPKLRYDSRKKIADSRPRVKGRFVKTVEPVRAGEATPAGPAAPAPAAPAPAAPAPPA